MGISKKEIDISVYGGADTIKNIFKHQSIGKTNSETAKKILGEYKLKIKNINIGGENARTLYFVTDTGEIFLKQNK